MPDAAVVRPVGPGAVAAANTPVPPEPLALLDLAVRAARAGGQELVARAGNVTGVGYKSSATDPVSDADRASERAVVSVIRGARPDDGVLGEEGTDLGTATGLRWVVDPLDGTVNYLYGLPHSTVSVACEQARDGGWEAVVGVVHDPARGETFTAVRGGGARLDGARLDGARLDGARLDGARLDGARLAVRRPGALAQALVATGFSYHASSRARQAETLHLLLPRVRDIRSHGSAALELCWVAAGRCDAYYEDELSPWDWAAGALVAREAGAVVSALGTGVLAASPHLHAELLALL